MSKSRMKERMSGGDILVAISSAPWFSGVISVSHSPQRRQVAPGSHFLWLVAAKTLWQQFHPVPPSDNSDHPVHVLPSLIKSYATRTNQNIASKSCVVWKNCDTNWQSPAFLTYLLFLLIGIFLAICKQSTTAILFLVILVYAAMQSCAAVSLQHNNGI